MAVDNTLKMLQAILKGQEALKQELTVQMNKLEQKLGERIDKVEIRLKGVEEGLKAAITRIDKIGKQLAYLEDDTPTREEFEKLEQKVSATL